MAEIAIPGIDDAGFTSKKKQKGEAGDLSSAIDLIKSFSRFDPAIAFGDLDEDSDTVPVGELAAGIFGAKTVGDQLKKAADKVFEAAKLGRLDGKFVADTAEKFGLDGDSTKILKEFADSSVEHKAASQAFKTAKVPVLPAGKTNIAEREILALLESLNIQSEGNRLNTSKSRFGRAMAKLGSRIDNLGGSIEDIGKIASKVSKGKDLKLLKDGALPDLPSLEDQIVSEAKFKKPPVIDGSKLPALPSAAEQAGLDVRTGKVPAKIPRTIAERVTEPVARTGRNTKNRFLKALDAIKGKGGEIPTEKFDELMANKGFKNFAKKNPKLAATLAIGTVVGGGILGANLFQGERPDSIVSGTKGFDAKDFIKKRDSKKKTSTRSVDEDEEMFKRFDANIEATRKLLED
jgi:hypothetical protein